MSRPALYRQCVVRKVSGSATTEMTTWLPQQFAVLEAPLQFKRGDGTWDGGWKVRFVGRELQDERFVTQASRAHLKQRQASDL